ncbi:hypothetical protein FOZ63_021559, partial [Perkinsus olseni]
MSLCRPYRQTAVIARSEGLADRQRETSAADKRDCSSSGGVADTSIRGAATAFGLQAGASGLRVEGRPEGSLVHSQNRRNGAAKHHVVRHDVARVVDSCRSAGPSSIERPIMVPTTPLVGADQQ